MELVRGRSDVKNLLTYLLTVLLGLFLSVAYEIVLYDLLESFSLVVKVL